MGEDQIAQIFQYIDKSLEQRFKPIHDSIAGLCRNTERIFSRLDEFSGQIISNGKDFEFVQNEMQRNEQELKECRSNHDKETKECKANCDAKIATIKCSSENSTKSKIELWIYRACLGVTAGALGYFLKYFLDDIAK